MDISIDLTIGGKIYHIHPEVVNSLIVVFIISLISIVIGIKAKKADYKEKPKGILNIAEILVSGVDSLVVTTMGKANINFAPYVYSLTAFLLLSNTLGLFGLKPPTSNYNVTLTLALITIFLLHYNNIRFNGISGYVKGYFQPVSFLFPINILGELSKPISLSFRIFGNILSGTIIMTLIYSFLNSISVFITPFIAPIFHAYFDVFSGVIQTLVFVMLTMINISQAIGDRE